MPKDAYINARVDKRLKARAERVLSRVGVSTTDAINMLLHQIVLRKGLPFEARLPSAETVAAMNELDSGGGNSSTASTRETFDRISKKRR
jgi:DNA-damage-inducible protein J